MTTDFTHTAAAWCETRVHPAAAGETRSFTARVTTAAYRPETSPHDPPNNTNQVTRPPVTATPPQQAAPGWSGSRDNTPSTTRNRRVTPETGAVAGAVRSDIPAIAALAARASDNQPWAQSLLPDARQRAKVLRAGFRLIVAHALQYGHVDLLTDGLGAAVWLDLTAPSPPPAAAPQHLTAQGGPDPTATTRLVEIVTGNPPGYAHLHLVTLACHVGPPARALLEHRHRRLDLTGVPAHTRAGDEDTLAFLTACGYRVQEPHQVPNGPGLQPMLRPPNPVRRHRQREPTSPPTSH